ncbi:MAG: GTP-binding protein [Parasporobacterium sp.]|nr:GTP-binding protein [Parasporobacterium sp.]
MSCCIDIYAGLLGCGKTSLIKKLLETEYRGKRVAVIENEIGSVNLDASELNTAEVSVREITGGCVCCSVSGNLTAALRQLAEKIEPDHIVIEPTGAADLTGLIHACSRSKDASLRRCVLLVNAKKWLILQRVAGEFYTDQIRTAGCVYLNFTEKLPPSQIDEIKQKIKELNPEAKIVDTPMALVDENTFAHCDLHTAGGSLQAEDPSSYAAAIQVLPLPERQKMIPKTRISGSEQKTLYTWTYFLDHPLTIQQFEILRVRMTEQKVSELWRVKGRIAISDGTVRKIDLTFGDFYEKEIEDPQTELTGQIVFIGPKINKKQITDMFSFP